MAHLAEAMAGRQGVFFDTSTWSPIDLLDFYRQVPPEQVVYASDYPYGQYTTSLFIALRTAQLAGYDEEQLRAMLAGNAAAHRGRRRAARADERRSAARHASPSRCSSRASTSTSRWRRRSSGRASPTRSACSGSRSTPAPSATAIADEVDRIRELLEAARDLWATGRRSRGRAARRPAGCTASGSSTSPTSRR